MEEDALNKIRKGVDPNLEKRQQARETEKSREREKITIGFAFEQYLAFQSGGHDGEAKEPRAAANTIRDLEKAKKRLEAGALWKPPLRSWDWLAEWLIREGVRPEDGHSPITGSSVGESWRRGAGEFQAKGLADPARAESVRERILGELLTEKEIAKILREQSMIKSSLPPDMDSADARLLRDALGSVKGMSLEQALLRLSKPIAILKPPVRQWSWIADWMSEQEVGARAGTALTGLSVSKAWSVAKSKGLIDETHAGPMRDRILDEPISDREVRAMLSGAAKPAASPSSSGARS